MQNTFELNVPEIKVIKKPWGQEDILELNEHYCYKKITIMEDQKTSLQYHERKIETNHLIYGKVQLWLGSRGDYDDNTMHQVLMLPGQHVTIPAGIVHRIVALADSILLEVSTPELDDVIRLEDDTNRPSGKIEEEHNA